MKELYQMTKEELFSYISAKESGLSKNEVKKQRKRFGNNQFENNKKKSIVKVCFSQWNDFYLIVLGITAILLGIVREWKDCFILFGVVLAGGIIKTIQVIRFRVYLEKRKKTAAYHTKVIRDGLIQLCSSDEIVVGDIILLEPGDFIYGDGRILEHKKIKVDESALIGEHTIVEKKDCILEKVTDRKKQINMVFAGSCVIEGETRILVTAVGMKTRIGKQLEEFYENKKLIEVSEIQPMLMKAESKSIIEPIVKSKIKTESTSIIKSNKTPFQTKIDKFCKRWISLVLVITVFLCFICLIRGDSKTTIVLYVTAFIIASVPESISFIITRMLSVGIKRLEKKKIVIQNPRAIEQLNQVSVICLNEMGLFTQKKKEIEQILIECKKLGIQPIIMTEEKREKIIRIAKQINLLIEETQIIEGSVIDKLMDSELDEIVEHILIYQNISSKNKIRIIEAWQRKRMIVAITEGSIWDMLVLQQADICIGVGTIGRKITKQIVPVMIDKNLTAITKTIVESKVIYNKMQKVISLFLSSSIAASICILLSFSFALPVPFTPMQLVGINIVIDIIMFVLIGVPSFYKNNIQERADIKTASILTKEDIQEITRKGMSLAILIMIIYGISFCMAEGYIAGMIALVLFCLSRIIYGIYVCMGLDKR